MQCWKDVGLQDGGPQRLSSLPFAVCAAPLSRNRAATLDRCASRVTEDTLLPLSGARTLVCEQLHQMPRHGYIAPVNDPTIDVAGFMGVDPKDPRSLGEGPCESHFQIDATADCQSLELTTVGGNPHARWARCRRCGLDLGYWPKLGCTGEHRSRPKPEHVRRALAMLEETAMKPSAKILRSYIVMAQQETRANVTVSLGRAHVTVDMTKPRETRRAESSPPVNPSQAPWAPLTPRARRPEGTASPQRAEALESQLEAMAVREKVLQAESAAAQRKSEERERLLVERLATLERNLGVCAPSPPDPDLMSIPDQGSESQGSGWESVRRWESVAVPP